MQPRSYHAATLFSGSHALSCTLVCSAFVQMENNEDDIVQVFTILTLITGNTTDSIKYYIVHDAYDILRTLE